VVVVAVADVGMSEERKRVHNCPFCECTETVPAAEVVYRVHRGYQNQTVDKATRRNVEWTEAEYKVLMSDLTAREVAQRLGRTYWAVKHARRRLRGAETDTPDL
jgi:hypothetical protein